VLILAGSTLKSTTTITANSLLKHYHKAHIKATANITVSANAIAIKKGTAQIAAAANVIANTLLKQYANSQIKATANLASNAKVLKYANVSIVTNTGLTINTKLYERIRASSQARATTDLTANTLLRHHASPYIKCSSALTVNAKWIFVKRSNGDLKAATRLIADSEVYTIVKASGDVCCKALLTVDSLVKSYGHCNIPISAELIVGNNIMKVLANTTIRVHADVITDEIVTAFEQAILTSRATLKTNSIVRKNASAELTTSSAMEVNSIVTIYANVLIEAGAKINIATKKAILTGFADTDAYFFNFGGKCYFYNGSDYYCYDGTTVGKVTDIAYVPTITMGRAPTGGGTAYEDLNYLSNSWIDSFSGTADAVEYHLSFAGLSDTLVKVWVNGELKEEVTDFTVDRQTGIVTFPVAPGEGTDNIKIQAEKDNLMNPDYILKCTQMVIYGGKNDNRVFACRGNTRYHSGLNNPTYWPENNYAAITSDAENLVGFGKMYDYLINLKENSITFTTLDTNPSGDVIFAVYPLNDEYGCLAPDSIQPVANGLIFLAQTNTGAPAGVVFLSPTAVRNQLNVRVISEDINKSVHVGVTGLTEYTRTELAAAKSYIHDKKYWLRVGDRVWILDLRESDFSMGKYCWYPYDGPASKANCFMEHEGNFYVGGDTGGIIYRENEELNDIQDAINARWTSPIVFCGSRSWTKDFEELHIVFGPQVRANHTLSFITDDGQEDVPLEIEAARVFTYAGISYGEFTYGSNPYPSKQTELVGYSAEYLQWIIANNELNQGLTILSQELDYLWGERS
jgi:ribosomal protein S17